MPEPFAEDELATCKTSTYVEDLPILDRLIMRTSRNTQMNCILDTFGERESDTLSLNSVSCTEEKDNIEQELVLCTKECNNSDAGTHIMNKLSAVCHIFKPFIMPSVLLISSIWHSSRDGSDDDVAGGDSSRDGSDDDVAGNKKHTTSQMSLAFLQSVLDNKQKYSYSETKQKEREHPDDSGKITNQTYRLKISSAQKGDAAGEIKEYQEHFDDVQIRIKFIAESKQPAEVPSDRYTYRTSITTSHEQGGQTRSDGTHSRTCISKRRSADFMDKQMLQTNVKMKNTSEIGWKTSFTKHRLLDFKRLLLLSLTLLLTAEPIQGTNQHVACVKPAFAELRTGYVELHNNIKRGYLPIESNEVGYDTTLPDPLPMTADVGKKLPNLDPWTSKMEKSEQEGLNQSCTVLVLELCIGFIMILIFPFTILGERKRLKSMESENSGHKDEKKEFTTQLNNIQATVQTENSEQDKLVSSLTGCVPLAKSTLIHTSGKCSREKYINSGICSYVSLPEADYATPMQVENLLYKEYQLSLTPDLPNASVLGFSELQTSECMVSPPETCMGPDYCKDTTGLKQLSVDDYTYTTELQMLVTDNSTDTCPKKCVKEVSNDSECTSSESNDYTKSFTSSYPIQSRSLTDRKTSLYTNSLSSNVTGSGQTGEMKDNPLKRCDAILENIVKESPLETENFSESERKKALQMLNEDFEHSLYQQYLDPDTKSCGFKEYDWYELELSVTDDDHIEFSDFEDSCVTDAEDDSQETVQNDKVDAYFDDFEERHHSQSTTNNAKHTSVVEHHSLMALEETENPHNVKENKDSQKLVENAIFFREKGKTDPECHQGNSYVKNMKENYHMEDMNEDNNLQTDEEHTNAGEEMVKSQNFKEKANITEENDSIQSTKSENQSEEDVNSLNFSVNPDEHSNEENAYMPIVEEKTDLQMVEETSNLQKVEEDVYSQSVKGNANMHVIKECNSHIQKGNDGCQTNLNRQTRANYDKSVAIEKKSLINGKASLTGIDVSEMETSQVEDTSRISCIVKGNLGEKKSLYNEDINSVSKGIQGLKEADSKLNKKTKETEPDCNDMEDKRILQSVKNIQADVDDNTKETVHVRNMQDVKINLKRQTMMAKDTLDEGIASFEEIAEEGKSFISLNEEGTVQGNEAHFTILNRMEEDVKQDVNFSSEEIISTLEGTRQGNMIKDEIKLQENQSVNSDETKRASLNSTISEDEGYLSGIKMDSKCCSQYNVQEEIEDLSWSKQDRERNSKRRDEPIDVLEISARTVLKPTESYGISCFLTTEYSTDGYLRLIKDNIIAKLTLSLDLDEAEKCLMASSISKDKVLAEKSVNQDNEHFKKEEAKDVSNAILWEENTTSNEINCDDEKKTLRGKDTFQANTTEKSENIKEKCKYPPSCLGHTKVCDSPENEFETKKGDNMDKQTSDSIAAHDNVKYEQSQAQHSVEQNIGHTKPHVTEENVKCDLGLKMIEHGSARVPNSQEGDLRKLIEKTRNECLSKQNFLILPGHPVDCGLKSVSHQRLEKSAHFQQKHISLSRQKNVRISDLRVNMDYLSYKTDEESVSSLPNAAEYKTGDYSYEICKEHRKPWDKIMPYNDRYHSCIIRKRGFQKSQQKNSLGIVRKLSQFPPNHGSSLKLLKISQQMSNLDREERVKSAIRKRRLRRSNCTRKEQCSSVDKSPNGDFEMQQGLPYPTKLEIDVTKLKSRIICNGSIKQIKGKHSITRAERCQSYHRNVSAVDDKSTSDENPSIERSFILHPERDEAVLHTFGKSIDSGLGTIESIRSDVILEMKTFEHKFYNNKVKLSSNKLKKLKRKLSKKERKVKKKISSDYMNTIFNQRHFRPELSSIIVYPGLQRYFERLNEGPLTREESLSFEWLRLESLRNYDGAGSIIQLARGGFYHDPVDGPLSTRCYACNVLYTNWEYFDNVMEVHRRLSPNCPHLRGNASGNVSIDDRPTNSLSNRTGSSVTVECEEDSVSEHDSQSANTVSGITDSLRVTQISDMVAEGFPHQPTEDRLNTEYNRSSPSLSATGHGLNLAIGQRTETKAANQSGNTENGQDVNNTATSVTSGDRPDVRNQPNQTRPPSVATTVSSPVFTGASKVRERSQGNGGFTQNTASSAQIGQQADTVVQALNNPLLVHVTNPKYSEYDTIDSRSRSFTTMWPSYLDQTPQQMAEAGFFYAGVADFTRCFACGGGLRNWEAGDDPCLEHTRWYPRCEYMNKLKGSRYVEAVTRRQEEHLAEQRRRNAEQQAQRRQAATNVSQDPMATPAAQTLLEMGYSRERTKEAILAVRRNTGHNFVSAEQALIWILDRDEEEDEQPPAITTAVRITTGNSTSTTQSTPSTNTSESTATSSSSSQSANESGTSSASSASGQSQGGKGQGRSQSGREKSGNPTSDDKNTAAEDESSEQKGANGNGGQAQGRQKKKGKKKGKGGGANGKWGGNSGLKGGARNEEEVAGASVPTVIDTESLKAENEKLKEMQTCKICMDSPVNVTLLPCGHLVCCDSCAPQLRKCPICRRRIEGSIKTFMS